jgi:hypothetical protein
MASPIWVARRHLRWLAARISDSSRTPRGSGKCSASDESGYGHWRIRPRTCPNSGESGDEDIRSLAFNSRIVYSQNRIRRIGLRTCVARSPHPPENEPAFLAPVADARRPAFRLGHPDATPTLPDTPCDECVHAPGVESHLWIALRRGEQAPTEGSASTTRGTSPRPTIPRTSLAQPKEDLR